MDDFSQNLQLLLSKLVEFIPKLVTAMVVLVLAVLVAGLISRTVVRALKRRETDPELTILFGKVVRWTVIILGSALALEQIDFDLTAFLTGLGIIGFTVGFAIQDVSKNFVAGLLLLLEQPFDIGDAIEVGEFAGTVLTVELRDTELRTFDGRHVLIPNADVFTNPIVNYSRAVRRRIDLDVGVAYDSDIERLALQPFQQALAAEVGRTRLDRLRAFRHEHPPL